MNSSATQMWGIIYGKPWEATMASKLACADVFKVVAPGTLAQTTGLQGP